jgi:hypothetical protein
MRGWLHLQKALAVGLHELSFTGVSDVVINVHPSPFQEPDFVIPAPTPYGISSSLLVLCGKNDRTECQNAFSFLYSRMHLCSKMLIMHFEY